MRDSHLAESKQSIGLLAAVFQRVAGGIIFPALFAVSLFHFAAVGAHQFLLADTSSAALIAVLFVVQAAFMIFLFKTPQDSGSCSRKILMLHHVQPIIFTLIFLSIQMLMVGLRGFERLMSLVEDPQSFAYYSLALRISDPATYVDEWLALMQVPLLHWGGHLATHFPGYPLLIYTGFYVFGRSPHSVIMLVTALSALAILPLYYLAREAYGPNAATLSCILYSWIPSISLDLPYMDLTAAVFILSSILLFLKSQQEGKSPYSFFGGILLFLATFLTFVSMAALVIVLIMAAWSDELRCAASRLFYFICGLIIPYVLLQLLFGMPFLEAASWAFRTNWWFHQHLYSLSPTVWSMEYSTVLFFVLLGFPTFLIFLGVNLRVLKSLIRGSAVNVLTLGISLMLLLTVTVARLELTRVAVFSTPFIAACTAAEATWKTSRSMIVDSLLLSSAQYLETFTYLSQATLLSRILGYPVA
ncbi:MAG: glycosyltransferase family 39 protein [Candidatus Bathyarchaeia archaeon]